MAYNLSQMTGRRRRTKLGAIEPTKRHAAMLRAIILEVVKHYEAGETDLIERYLATARLGMPPDVQAQINQLRFDVSLPQQEAIEKLNAWTQVVSKWHDRKWQARVLGATGIDVMPLTRSETIGPALDVTRREAAALIRDIADDTADRVQSAVLEAYESGGGKAELAKLLREQFGYSRRRADLIAQDQLGKLTGELDRLRQTEAGIDSYQWLTIGDGRVRPAHAARNGTEFRWDDPPFDGHPGEAIRCRCRARAVIPGMNRFGET